MVHLITGDTPVYQLTVNQLLDVLATKNGPQSTTESKASPSLSSKRYLYGIRALAEFLDCSTPTAQKIKNSGKIPYSQTGRIIVFDADEVLRALNKKRAA